MPSRTVKTSNRQDPEDVGTLWTMHRWEHAARCTLISKRGAWEVRVLLDGGLLLEERCAQAAAAFTLAEHWRQRMLIQGWEQVLPHVRRQDEPEERQTPESFDTVRRDRRCDGAIP